MAETVGFMVLVALLMILLMYRPEVSSLIFLIPRFSIGLKYDLSLHFVLNLVVSFWCLQALL